MGKKTSIQISEETKERLVEIGSKNDSYDHIVSMLIDYYLDTKDNLK